MDASQRLIQNIFRSQAAYLQQTPQPLKNLKAIDAISHCRTKEMGVTYFTCKDKHQPFEQTHSCNHRSCYLCSEKRKQVWVEAQRKRLFNTPHFHVIFTLPHEYLNLWRYNEALFTQIIFKASQETLMDLLADKKHQGVKPGLLIALHTWGRQLSLHPHTHCLLTAGGLNDKKQWQVIDKFLLPIRVVKALYRGKTQALIKHAFEQGNVNLPPNMSTKDFYTLHQQSYKKSWSVRIEERYEHGKGVMLYLSRYLKGGPIHPKQISHCDGKEVSFRYLDHRDKKIKQLRIKMADFIQRVLSHVPAIGVHTVRSYGLYASSAKKSRDYCCELLGNLSNTRDEYRTQPHDMLLFCQQCGGCLRPSHSVWRSYRKGNSLIRTPSGGFVQQDDETNISRIRQTKDPGLFQV